MNPAKRALVNGRTAALEKSEKNLKAIYDIIFSDGKRIFGQYTDSNGIVKVTFGELKEMTLRYALFITENTDAKNEFIGLDSENCVSWVAAFWGILLSGNKPFLINCKQPENFKASMIKTLGARFIVGKKEHDLGAAYFTFDQVEEKEYTAEQIAAVSTDGMENHMAMSTSATSLNETICVYSGKELSECFFNVKNILEMNRRMPEYYRGALRQLAFLPFYHIFGFMAVYLWFTMYGCTMVFLENYSGETIMKTVRDHKVTHVFAVPLFWQTAETIIRKTVSRRGEKTEKKFEKALEFSGKLQKKMPYFGEWFARRLLKDVTKATFGYSIKFCINGGSPIKDSTLRFFNELGYPLHNGYGMTEIGITSVNLEKNIEGRISGTTGYPFRSVKYIVGEDNILTVEGTSLCQYRIVNGVKTETNGKFVTGDIVKKEKYGYSILGRANDVIIGADGENINPDMIEKKFTIPYMQRFCIYGEETEKGQQAVMAVELKKICTPYQIKTTMETVEQQNNELPLTFRMKKIYYTYDLISSATAVKTSRKYLKRALENGSVHYISPETLVSGNAAKDDFDENSEVAKLVRDIISKTLGTEEKDILPDANVITDLGGSSLDYFYILSQINEKTGISLLTGEDHCPYTLREICREIGEQM